ncbi:MAG: hypothetical protein LBQ19_05620, partial [Synergistaceae bacterium]|nr:hypothetical protein [Synergistaceae bacterium]
MIRLSGKNGAKRARFVLRALLAAVFISALIPGGGFFMGVCEAGGISDLEQRIAAVTAMVASTTTDIYAFLKPILSDEQDIYSYEQQLDKMVEDYYEKDHERLENEHIVWTDQTDEIEELYGGLSSSGALSFAQSVDMERFEEQNPGYRQAQDGYTDFSEEYKERIEGWQEYIKGVLAANNSEAEGIRQSLETIEELKEASDSAGYYRKAMQAGNQIANFVNQEFDRLRIDIQRNIEAETKYALNEQQERTDIQSAFEGAIKSW